MFQGYWVTKRGEATSQPFEPLSPSPSAHRCAPRVPSSSPPPPHPQCECDRVHGHRLLRRGAGGDVPSERVPGHSLGPASRVVRLGWQRERHLVFGDDGLQRRHQRDRGVHRGHLHPDGQGAVHQRRVLLSVKGEGGGWRRRRGSRRGRPCIPWRGLKRARASPSRERARLWGGGFALSGAKGVKHVPRPTSTRPPALCTPLHNARMRRATSHRAAVRVGGLVVRVRRPTPPPPLASGRTAPRHTAPGLTRPPPARWCSTRRGRWAGAPICISGHGHENPPAHQKGYNNTK